LDQLDLKRIEKTIIWVNWISSWYVCSFVGESLPNNQMPKPPSR
jgi:hypothetical protein